MKREKGKLVVAGLQIIEVMMIILLAVVGSLVIWLHLRLNSLSSAIRHERELAKTLDKSLERAAEGIRALAKAAQEHSPELQAHIQKSYGVLQDFDYVIDRAEKVLHKMDEHPQMNMPKMSGDKVIPSVQVNASKNTQNLETKNVEESQQPKTKQTASKTGVQQNERSVLWGKDLEQVLSDKQENDSKKRKEDIRATFMNAMAERERRVNEEREVATPQINTARETLELLETVRKTAPRGYGANAYSQGEASQSEAENLRQILEAR